MQLKALQHELGCKNGILMSRKLVLEVTSIPFSHFKFATECLLITDTKNFFPRVKENQQHFNLERCINNTIVIL